MASILYKWFLHAALLILLPLHSIQSTHPLYVSVVEIEHSAKNKTLEISCKVFTDDFEKTLRQTYTGHVDLIDPKYKDAMNKLVDGYMQKHLAITVDGKTALLKFVGYEQLEEGIYCYYQADNIATVKDLDIMDNVLYDYKPEQFSLIHVTVNANRKSTKLNNPESKYSFRF